MEYRLDNYTRNPQFLLDRLAANCKARRLEKGYSRRTLSDLTGVPAPTIVSIGLGLPIAPDDVEAAMKR